MWSIQFLHDNILWMNTILYNFFLNLNTLQSLINYLTTFTFPNNYKSFEKEHGIHHWKYFNVKILSKQDFQICDFNTHRSWHIVDDSRTQSPITTYTFRFITWKKFPWNKMKHAICLILFTSSPLHLSCCS